MGMRSRRKGKAWEQEVARRFRDLGIECRRGWQSRAGNDEPDVILPPELGIWIECKVGACPNLWAAMDQAAAAAAPKGLAPMVFAHRDRGREVVVMELHDFLEWLRERCEGREAGGEEDVGDEGLSSHEEER